MMVSKITKMELTVCVQTFKNCDLLKTNKQSKCSITKNIYLSIPDRSLG